MIPTRIYRKFKNYEKYLIETDFNNKDQTLAAIAKISPLNEEPPYEEIYGNDRWNNLSLCRHVKV
jgi:hypothetical protein